MLTVGDKIPDYAKDLRLNLSSILFDQLIGETRKYGLFLACAHGSAYKPLVDAAEAEIVGKIDEPTANAARGAAVMKAIATVHATF